MAQFLFEIFSEEIPARMQVRAGQDLQRLLEAGLKEAGLDWLPDEGLSVFTGPRRIAIAGHLPEKSPDVREERKGPRVGSHEKAIEGFMRGAGIRDISEAEIRSDKKGEFYVAVTEKAGQATTDILATLLPKIMKDFPWPKSMKSGGSAFRWVRPLRGIIAMLDDQIIPFEIGGIKSGNVTYGHRQMGYRGAPITITPGKGFGAIMTYVQEVQGAGHVMLEHETRKQFIRDQVRYLCKQHELEWVEDEGLLDEVAGLVEHPVPLLGDMDPAFLELPVEVIRLTLKSHQKTFTVRGKDGKLAPHFVIIANLETADEGATIKAGNAKVISARLSDAKFFQDEDRKQSLESYYDKLDSVVFHKKLGSVRDKAERVAALAREIAPRVGADPDVAERAAKLAKCDLVTQSVIEFTSLQGKIGRWMYEAEGGDVDIATAIEEHYKPQGPSDAVPINPVAIAVALADKIDTLVGFWAIDEKPTGSKDPYALRRATLGVVRTILSSKIGLQTSIFRKHLVEVSRDIQHAEMVAAENEGGPLLSGDELDQAIQEYEKQNPHLAYSNDLIFQHDVDLVNADGSTAHDYRLLADSWVVSSLSDFLLDRLRVYLRDQGHRHDVIDAVIAQGGDDLLAISQRVEALGAFLSDADGEDLVQGYKRAANILRAEAKKGTVPGLDPGPIRQSDDGDKPAEWTPEQVRGPYTAPEAKILAAALTQTRPAIDAALSSADYPAALSALADLREPIDAFFEAVIVNSDDSDERARRLALLSAIVETFHQIADFSRLDG